MRKEEEEEKRRGVGEVESKTEGGGDATECLFVYVST